MFSLSPITPFRLPPFPAHLYVAPKIGLKRPKKYFFTPVVWFSTAGSFYNLDYIRLPYFICTVLTRTYKNRSESSLRYDST